MVLLTGCRASSKESTQRALDFRTRLMETGGCGFQAKVTADYGDHVYVFSMNCQADREETRLVVTAPPELSGIAAAVQENSTELLFDGAELDFGELDSRMPPPVSSPWLLVQCWVGEYIACTGPDEALERVTYLRGYDDEEVTVDTWFDSQGVPVYAEISRDDVRYLTLEISEFHF